ncbi:glucose dehydrogenase [Haloarcula hispanica]|uniref:Glucose 1-dehydrogenase n=1 Tax=Haloarcula hispanica TaxID=51589 RepID=A0A5J5LF50_HALHI|nr:glucose 1-dehydrogenase [Haloarcula hispanica]KAA9404849.1 glucose dehydrogenase [Haloarcula hispanica]
MDAIAVKRGKTRPERIDIERPEPDEGEVLVRTLRVGIDGTDFEVLSGSHGEFPEGSDYQILGHEAVGVVESSNGTALNEGEIVVPTVRRPANTSSRFFENNEPDMAPPGEYVERGIAGAHGYMAEYFTTPASFLVPIPESLADVGFLVEPISNAEKALELAQRSRSTFEWQNAAGLVLGNGPLGLLTLAMLADRCERTYCLGRRERPDPTIDIIEKLGATYVNSRQTAVDEIPDVHEPMDLVFEATGHAKHAFSTVEALGANGVGVLLGIPEDWEFTVNGGALHRQLVLQNKALLGSVNSNVRHYKRARNTLAEYPDWFLASIMTTQCSVSGFADAFEESPDTIKSYIEFSA